MTSIAPVCPISRSQPVPGQPPQTLIPPFRASDLPSLVAALNGAINNLNRLLGPGVPPNNRGPIVNVQPQPTSTAVQSYWYEETRNTNDGVIYNYDSSTGFDRSMYVEVTRIYGIEFSPEGSSVSQPMWWQWKEQPYTDGALQ